MPCESHRLLRRFAASSPAIRQRDVFVPAQASSHRANDYQNIMNKIFRRFFFWLSGAGTEALEKCPEWEQRKYVAFGATVLVPCSFAFIACAYALSTLTSEWRISFGVAAVWACIIMAIDRALLASYRPYLSIFRKFGQFSLRFVIAFLMGLTISHPLTLLLFRDTIQGVIEHDRRGEIESMEAATTAQKQVVQDKIAAEEADVASLQKQLDQTFSGNIPDNWELNAKQNGKAAADEDKAQADLNAQIGKAKAPVAERLAKIDEEMKPLLAQFTALQTDLDYWQKEYEREINGQRSGFMGVGPRARSVESDQLAWRRVESSRLSGMIEHLTSEKTRLRKEVAGIEGGMLKDFEERKMENEERQKEERGRVARLKKQIQEQQADALVTQLQQTRNTISTQIQTKLDEVKRLHGEIATLTQHTGERVMQIQNVSRRDILTQTLALHRLFRQGDGAGEFALGAYAVLTALFMLVDTIPLIVKFFTRAGPYDTLLDRDEILFDTEHRLFRDSYNRYATELNRGSLLSLTQNKPLERALVEGIERSRVAKQFIESLMEMEKSFQERMTLEQQALANASLVERESKKAMLEKMASTFYTDLHQRMAQFFEDGRATGAAS